MLAFQLIGLVFVLMIFGAMVTGNAKVARR
jgi:hypothetical protein